MEKVYLLVFKDEVEKDYVFKYKETAQEYVNGTGSDRYFYKIIAVWFIEY